MATARHYVIIGSGSAGNGAATTLRERDPKCRITMITMSSLPFYNRYDLPRVFQGCHDWRELLPFPPSHYDDLRIALRRSSRVVDIDGRAQTIELSHSEALAYDRLLVCAGGRSYLPENLSDYRELMHGFGSFEAAMAMHADLPEGGTVIMLGGDMIGIDLVLALLETGYRVTLIANQYTFWPHTLEAEERERFIGALQKLGVEVIDGRNPISVEEGGKGKWARTVVFEDGGKISGDVVMPFCGLVPSVEFMLGADVDIERGILVNPQLRTTNKNIWAAGDVCQIWSDQEKAYKFYHGWRNVRIMGELAARNMSGANETFAVNGDGELSLDKKGRIQSEFWEH